MKRPVTFTEGYRAMRTMRFGVIISAFCAVVWVIRGDMITVEE